MRIKHRYNGNSVKLDDKAYTPVGSVLRAELTMDDPEDFRVYRRPEGDPDAPLAWLRRRKGFADLHFREEVSQKANERYLNALASVDDSTCLREVVGPIEKPVSGNDKRVRALHPFNDLRLLRAHRLIRRVPGSHRYHVTVLGRHIAAGVIAAANATVNLLIPKAA